jgi:putative oxidoreductase
MSSTSITKNHDLALLLLRIGVGLIFIVAGWGKITGIEGTQQFFGNIGIPMAGIMAWVVAIVELVGGLMVLTGYKIQIPAVLLAIVMLVAILTTKLGNENMFRAMRLDLILLLVNLSLAILGSGKYSLEHKLKKS